VLEPLADPTLLGDMDPEEFRQSASQLVDWIARYLAGGDRYPVLSRVQPGEIRDALPSAAPEQGEPMRQILADFERILVPGLTHWNHPGFFAYFPTSGSGPGVLAELLTAALNQQAMLWRTSPAATELEEVALGWLRDLLGLPADFEGVIYEGGSASNLHALLAAREVAVPGVRSRGLAARGDLPRLRVYASEAVHSSVDKALIVLGLGHEALRRIPLDAEHRMRPEALEAALREDEAAGVLPVAVVATVGTTSTSSVDPVPALAEICRERGIWLHVDASYGGAAAMLPERAWIFDGVAQADSLVVNPHKWLFTPLDLSAFYCRRMDVLRSALALTPAYLETKETGAVHNLMDTGVALGRRFRALKLWMVLRYFGADGLRARIAEHIRLARLFASWVDTDGDFEVLAPVPLSLVCFRAAPPALAPDWAALDALNERLLECVNASGEVYLSHTRISGRYALRLAVGQIRTSEIEVARAWELLRRELSALIDPYRSYQAARMGRELRGTAAVIPGAEPGARP
jgi:aromatic-L-amino-acid decarboxylase